MEMREGPGVGIQWMPFPDGAGAKGSPLPSCQRSLTSLCISGAVILGKRKSSIYFALIPATLGTSFQQVL